MSTAASAAASAEGAVRYAGVGVRAVATVIDTVVLFAIFYLIAAASGQTTGDGFELSGAPFFLAVLLAFVYYIALEARFGATVGKFAVRLRVQKEDGAPISWSDSTVRNVLRIVDGFVFYILGAIFVWRSSQRQRLGDRMASTVVVRCPEARP